MSYLDDVLEIVNESYVDGDYGDSDLYDLDPAVETTLFIQWVKDAFTATEAIDILSNAEELAMYGLVDDVQQCYEALQGMVGEFEGSPLTAVTEARKMMAVDDWKKKTFKRQVYRNAMALGVKDKDTHALKAQKYKKLFIQERNAVYKKYYSKAVKYTRAQMRSNKNKASNMKSAAGHQISDKIDKTLKQVDAKGRNKKAIKK